VTRSKLLILFLGLTLLVCGCDTYDRHGLDAVSAHQVEISCVCRKYNLSPEAEKGILALDPEHVSEKEIRGVLSGVPAPRIINIHGGISPVHLRMISFSEFLIGMGYPGTSITNPGDGTYTFSCYESSEMIAGMIAWYYEKEGLRPIIVGHSQGGMQTVKVLRKLAGLSAKRLHVWNPLTWSQEEACEIVDPLTGEKRPVVGLVLPYATVTGAGGVTRFLPNQWDMWLTLRKIPNSVEEFTGFYKHKDLLGGDYLGWGSANCFESMDKAVVRNVQLPSYYKHGAIPDTRHLLKSQQIMDWINNYQPSPEPVHIAKLDTTFDADSDHILWAADVWYGIKKHWVLELQRYIRAHQLSEQAGE
jgi:pimeloyl-ACP methyl ester carboxylesterase